MSVAGEMLTKERVNGDLPGRGFVALKRAELNWVW